MRALLGFGLAVLLVVSAGVSAQDKDKVDGKKLIGKWEPTTLPPGAKAVIEFTKDNKLVVSFTIGDKTEKIDGTYKLDGNKLMVDLKDKKETNTVTKLTDEDLVVKDEKGKEEAFKRLKEKK
jgi:uncharacterized protein (TIGR03066 family)